MSAVERIEIIRGPASALYGADAFLGVVNIITRTGKDIAGADARIGVTKSSKTDPQLGEDVAVGAVNGNWDISLAARNDKQDLSGLKVPASSPAPQIPSYNADSRTASGLTQSSQVAHGRVQYSDGGFHASLVGYYSQIERVAEFSPLAQLTYGYDEEGRLNGTVVARRQGMAALELSQKFSSSLALDLTSTFFTGGPTKNDKTDLGSPIYFAKRDFSYAGNDSSLEAHWDVLPSVSIVGGGQFVLDREQLPSNLYMLKQNPTEVIENLSVRQGRQNFITDGLFVQAKWKAIPQLLIMTGGVRWDHHNLYGDQVSSRLAAVINPHKNLYFKVLYSGAFKAPSPFLLYAQPLEAGDVVGNPHLRPEYVHAVEAQVTYRHPYFSISSGVAYNILQNMAEFTQQGVNKIARNLSNIDSISWESELSFGYRELIRGYITSELQRTIRYSGHPEEYAASLVGYSNVIYPDYILRGGLISVQRELHLQISVEGDYVGPRRASDMNALDAGHAYSLRPYCTLGMTFSTVDLHFFEHGGTTMSLSVRNLLNTTSADPGFGGVDYPRDGITFFMQLRQIF
jgi:iron complex outermembrane receptor protein